MLAHDRPLVHGRGALGSPHGHAPSFAANTGPREVTSSAAPREHAPAGGREGEVYRPSYAARALVWVRWTRGAPWFGCCSRGAAQLEARRGEHLHYAQPRVLVGPTSRRGRGCILLVIPRACHRPGPCVWSNDVQCTHLKSESSHLLCVKRFSRFRESDYSGNGKFIAPQISLHVPRSGAILSGPHTKLHGGGPLPYTPTD